MPNGRRRCRRELRSSKAEDACRWCIRAGCNPLSPLTRPCPLKESQSERGLGMQGLSRVCVRFAVRVRYGPLFDVWFRLFSSSLAAPLCPFFGGAGRRRRSARAVCPSAAGPSATRPQGHGACVNPTFSTRSRSASEPFRSHTHQRTARVPARIDRALQARGIDVNTQADGNNGLTIPGASPGAATLTIDRSLSAFHDGPPDGAQSWTKDPSGKP